MSKVSQRIKARREERRKQNEIRNPVTGSVFTKAEKRQFKKFGVDENGRLRSKYETSHRKLNHDVRIRRTEKREKVQHKRAETGNTFMNGLAKSIQSISGLFGGKQVEYEHEPDEIYYEDTESENPYNESNLPNNIRNLD